MNPEKLFEAFSTGVLRHTIGVLIGLLSGLEQRHGNLFTQVDQHLDLIEGESVVPYVEGTTLKFKTIESLIPSETQQGS